MKYKFHIYKQANLDLNTFNKYDITDYGFFCEITQRAQWEIKVERNTEWFTVIRREFSGSISVAGDDFTVLQALEGDHKQYAVIIYLECSGVYSEFWKGYFSYLDYKVDLDRCQLTFTPVVWDKYSPVMDQLPIQRNAVAADIDRTVNMTSFAWPYESVMYSYVYAGPFVPAMWTEYTGFTGGNQYYLYSQSWTQIEFNPLLSQWSYTIDKEYRRDYSLSDSNSVAPGPNFILDPLLTGGEFSPGVYKWVRPFMNSVYTTYTPAIGPSPIIQTLILTGSAVTTLYGCKLLMTVLQYFADFCDEATVVSDFFTDSPCPMGGNTLVNTMMQQISNVSATGEQAIKGMMTLKDLLTTIRDTFNVYWYIDSNEDFRLEHRKYFDYGLSYTYTHVIELDLSALYPEEIKHLRRYEYSKPALVRYEKIEIPYSYSSDWLEASIEYPQLSITTNETKTRTVIWGTDIWLMYENKGDLSKQGWTLLNVNYLPASATYEVALTAGALSGAVIANGRFSQANLLRDLWGYGRLLPTGKVNGVLTTFGSTEMIKKQVEITIPQCCQDIDYNGLFRTPLGDGRIQSADYEGKTGNLKISMMYE